jgi:hypothetical protein
MTVSEFLLSKGVEATAVQEYFKLLRAFYEKWRPRTSKSVKLLDAIDNESLLRAYDLRSRSAGRPGVEALESEALRLDADTSAMRAEISQSAPESFAYAVNCGYMRI